MLLLALESIAACYGEVFSISCSEDNFILVNFAAFGYFGTGKKCNAQSSLECWVDSTYFISAMCTGQHSCQSKVQYSHDLSSKSLGAKCASAVKLTLPHLFVQYLCIKSSKFLNFIIFFLNLILILLSYSPTIINSGCQELRFRSRWWLSRYA